MIDIFVQRGAGDRRGPDITDPLLTSLAAALSRGQVEIDAASPIRTVQLQCTFRPGLRPGQLVEVIDALQGAAWRGLIVAVDNAVEQTGMVSRLTVERPL